MPITPKIISSAKNIFPRAIEIAEAPGNKRIIPLFNGRGDISADKLRRYVQIFDDNMANPDMAEAVMRDTGLPMESVILMQSPEFYKALLDTNTRMVKINPQYNLFDDYGRIGGLNRFNAQNAFLASNPSAAPGFAGNNYAGIIDLIDLPSGKTHLNLDEVPLFVTYHSNRYPAMNEFVFPGSRGYVSSRNLSNYGFYTADDAWLASTFGSDNTGPGRVITHKLALFGNPYLADLNGNIEFMPNTNMFRQTYNIPKEAFDMAHEKGYDIFVDPFNAFRVTDNPYYVKDLLHNNGNFDVTDISRFHKNGGRLVKHRFKNSCKNDYK